MPLVSNEPSTIELTELKLVGTCAFADFFANGQQTIFGEAWQRLHECKFADGVLANPTQAFGLELYPPSFPTDRRWYYGEFLEMKTLEAVYPSGVLYRYIPATTYLKFTVAGPVTEIAPAFRHIYDAWLPAAGVKLAGYYDMELYDERFKGPDNPDSQVDILLPLA